MCLESRPLNGFEVVVNVSLRVAYHVFTVEFVFPE